MRKRREPWRAGESGFGRWKPQWGLERKAMEVAAWRNELELRLMGAMLHYPRLGLLRATECGLTDQHFECDDLRLMFQAVCCCEENGMIEEKGPVLAMVMVALRWGRWWDPRAIACERGFYWSELNLADLACAGDVGPGEVRLYSKQLIELDLAVREARRLWQRMTELLDGVGYVEELDGTCRATPMQTWIDQQRQKGA